MTPVLASDSREPAVGDVIDVIEVVAPPRPTSPPPLPPQLPLPQASPPSPKARAACDLIERLATTPIHDATERAAVSDTNLESPDDLLILPGWGALFEQPKHVGETTARPVLELRDTCELDVAKIFAEPPTVLDVAPQRAHICRHCHRLSSGEELGERRWMCGGCRLIDTY